MRIAMIVAAAAMAVALGGCMATDAAGDANLASTGAQCTVAQAMASTTMSDSQTPATAGCATSHRGAVSPFELNPNEGANN